MDFKNKIGNNLSKGAPYFLMGVTHLFQLQGAYIMNKRLHLSLGHEYFKVYFAYLFANGLLF